MDLTLWNKAAIVKHFWTVSMKQDMLWIKWLHVYHIKHHNVLTMDIPNRLSWSMKKILSSRLMFLKNQAPWTLLTAPKFSITRTYSVLQSDHPRVMWIRIICNIKFSPKTLFITWLALHERLATKDKWCALEGVGVIVDNRYVFYHTTTSKI